MAQNAPADPYASLCRDCNTMRPGGYRCVQPPATQGFFLEGKGNAAESPQYTQNGPRNPDDVVEFRCDHGDASGADR